ncbi:MAG: NADH-quinone oxidoreductase subunit NuoE [Clostridiales bacterium]|nr:NADH-quinone oxidoreductase subunit NuoE [Clostridiales bacterium]
MKKPISKIPFNGTPEQEAKLKAAIERSNGNKSELIYIMQQAQDIYGYLPYEVQVMIAEGMDVPLEKVYGVATFYSQFALSPKGKNAISVCLGTACYVKGSKAVMDKFSSELGIEPGQCTADGEFSLESCRCVGACGLAPVCVVNDDVYGKVTPEKVVEIIAKYKSK